MRNSPYEGSDGNGVWNYVDAWSAKMDSCHRDPTRQSQRFPFLPRSNEWYPSSLIYFQEHFSDGPSSSRRYPHTGCPQNFPYPWLRLTQDALATHVHRKHILTPVTFSEHSLVPASRGKYRITFSALDQTVCKPSHASADRWTDAVLSWKKLDFHSILQTSPLILLKTNGPSVSLTLPATTFTDTWLWNLCALLGWKTLEVAPLHSNRKTEGRKDPYAERKHSMKD